MKTIAITDNIHKAIKITGTVKDNKTIAEMLEIMVRYYCKANNIKVDK